LVVAPLRIARGIQNKVLEAMAMARPVIASPAAFRGIDAEPGRDLIVSSDEGAAVADLLADATTAAAMGAAARRQMEKSYRWSARLAPLAAMLAPEREAA
jgi:glycosyltransferase involved in cell wall biosynthesis